MCVPTLQMDNLTPMKLSDVSKVTLIHRRWNWKLRPASVPRLLGNREFLFFPFLVSMETDLGTHLPARGTVMTSCLWDTRRDCAALWAVAQPPGGAHPHFWLCRPNPSTQPHRVRDLRLHLAPYVSPGGSYPLSWPQHPPPLTWGTGDRASLLLLGHGLL